ncbi:MAG: sulfatase-like hydrolase/transferase, partial [Planctomycetota bacterium]
MNRRPHILHLMVDQQRADTLAALGNSVIRTPHLDRLAHEGVSFIRAYSPCPVCVPARASMIHGQHPHHTGCYENCCANPAIAVHERQTFMHALTGAGYRTHGVGKCHFMPDRDALRGFQSRRSQEAGYGPPESNDYARWLDDQGLPYIGDPAGVGSEMYYVPQLAPVPASHHPTQWVADESIRFLQQQADDPDQPWYLYTSFLHPHPPFSPPYPWHTHYTPSRMPLPRVPQDHASLLTYVNRVQNRYKGIDCGINQNLIQCVIAYYYACISFIDHQIGRLLETLEQTGQLDDTLIVFTSDHGEFLGDYHSYGKRSFLDASARVPMLLRWPDLGVAGQRCDVPVSLIDLAPTFTEAGKASVTSHELDGESLLAAATGGPRRPYVFGQHAYTHHVDGSAARHVDV